MATDKLKKDKARNSKPPDSAPVPGNEGAYGNPSVTAADDVGLTKTERLNPIGSGILSDQSREHGKTYPGRPYPPTQVVTTCTAKEGVAKKSAETQTDANRHELNSHKH